MKEPDGRPADRLRVAPAARFAGESRVLDLHDELTRLRAESHPAKRGHRQVTLFHRPPISHVLFSFDAGGALKRHAADGLVTIQVLEGQIVVETDAGGDALRSGQVLVLNPKVAHAVRAPEASAMLLTIAMEGRREEE